MKTSLLRLLPLFALGGLAHGAELIATGDWVQSINATHLVAGAGSDLQAQFDSVSGITTLTIANAPGAWTLRVRRGGSGGHGEVTVHVKRTSAGSGSGTIEGGTAFLALTASDAELFSGTEDRGSVSLQFKLTGLTRNVSPTTYLSSIIFTVQ